MLRKISQKAIVPEWEILAVLLAAETGQSAVEWHRVAGELSEISLLSEMAMMRVMRKVIKVMKSEKDKKPFIILKKALAEIGNEVSGDFVFYVEDGEMKMKYDKSSMFKKISKKDRRDDRIIVISATACALGESLLDLYSDFLKALYPKRKAS